MRLVCLLLYSQKTPSGQQTLLLHRPLWPTRTLETTHTGLSRQAEAMLASPNHSRSVNFLLSALQRSSLTHAFSKRRSVCIRGLFPTPGHYGTSIFRKYVRPRTFNLGSTFIVLRSARQMKLVWTAV